MNRPEIQRLLASVSSNADVAATLLNDSTLTAREQELELLTRLNYIDARMSQLRAEVCRKDSGAENTRPAGGHLRALGGSETPAA